jgi:hypothetical protein
MDMTRFSGEDYVKTDHVRDGPIRAKIVNVKEEGNFGRPELILDTDQILTVNFSNNRILVEAFGPDSDDWIGQRLKLTLGKVSYKGELVDSVIIQPISPQTIKKVTKRPPPFDDDIGL